MSAESGELVGKMMTVHRTRWFMLLMAQQEQMRIGYWKIP